ncbi:MAG: site-specific integrase [Deltaproteobacteria bacterium]|nr:site-specific integrase [Deltaproteobacteria bacterium]
MFKNWKGFEDWCQFNHLSAFPSSIHTLEVYLTYLALQGKKTSTIEQAKWSIDARHKMAGYPPPGQAERVKATLNGIRRKQGMASTSKEALTIDHIRTIRFESTLGGLRDKALLLFGFAGGFRRSELANIRVSDLSQTDFGFRVLIQKSKTDQEGRGEWVNVVSSSYSKTDCPVQALQAWLKAANIQSGLVFRGLTKGGHLRSALSTVSIGLIVKKAAIACGLDSTQYGGHSLRAGCATYLLDKNIPLNIVAKQLRHRKADTTLRYDRNTTSKAIKGVY